MSRRPRPTRGVPPGTAITLGLLGSAWGLAGPDVAPTRAEEPATVPARPAERPLSFGIVELPERLTVGYAVRMAPIVGDERPDIAIVDSKRILALECPTWRTHVLHEDAARTDNVCFAWGDLDGDGDLDAALGADWTVNTGVGGTVEWIENPGAARPAGGAGGPSATTAWARRPVTTEPTVHRMHLLDDDGDGRPSLFVLPLMGRGTTKPDFAEAGVRFLRLDVPDEPATRPWPATVVDDDLHVTHNFHVADVTGDGRPELIVVSFEGVHLLVRGADGSWERTLLGTGEQTTTPNRGASEIGLGRLADGSPYLATIEPWHGDRVVVYRPRTDSAKDDPFQLALPADRRAPWRRTIVDTQLKWGHAVATANLDGDADEELVVRVRDTLSPEHPCGVRVFDPVDADAGRWDATRLDPGGVAVEDLTTGDLDGDGRTDLVAVGRATHNVKLYLNQNR